MTQNPQGNRALMKFAAVEGILIAILGFTLLFQTLARRTGGQDWSSAARRSAVASGPDFLVTREAYVAALRKANVPFGDQSAFLQASRSILEELINQELLAGHAAAQGLDKGPEVRTIVNRALADAALNAALSEVTLQEISPDAVAARYATDRADYSRPEAVRVAHLLFRPSPDSGAAGRADARSRAEAALPQAQAFRARSLSFGELAKQLSEDEGTKHSGGDLGIVTRGDPKIPGAVTEAAFGLQQIGDVSNVVESPDGFHIVRLTGRRPALERALPEVEDEIRRKLLSERRAARRTEFLATLKRRGSVVIHEDRLDVREELVPPRGALAGGPPGLPPGN